MGWYQIRRFLVLKTLCKRKRVDPFIRYMRVCIMGHNFRKHVQFMRSHTAHCLPQMDFLTFFLIWWMCYRQTLCSMFVMKRGCHRIGFLKRKDEFDRGATTHKLIEINMITLIFEFLHNVALLCLNLMLRNFF